MCPILRLVDAKVCDFCVIARFGNSRGASSHLIFVDQRIALHPQWELDIPWRDAKGHDVNFVEDAKYVDRQLCQIDKYVDGLYRGNLRPH